MKIKKFIVFILIVLITLFCCGCYDYSEAETLSIISCAAIDYSEGQYELLIFASNFADSNENDSRQITLSSNGESLERAVKNIEKEYGTHLYWSHCETVILGKELVEKGIYDVLDFVLYTSDARITTNLLVAKERASEILNSDEDFGKDITKVIDFDKKLNSCPVYTIYKKAASKTEYLLPMIILSDKGKGFEIHLCAQFSSDRFQGVIRY